MPYSTVNIILILNFSLFHYSLFYNYSYKSTQNERIKWFRLVIIKCTDVISGFTFKLYGARWNDDRSSDKSAIKRREPIRFSSIPCPIHMDRSVANSFGHVFFVARNRRIFNIGNCNVVYFHTVTRWKHERLRNDNNSFRCAHLSWRLGFYFRLVGEKSFSTSVQDGQENGRTWPFDERNHCGYTSDQNVYLGKAFCKNHWIREKVNASVSFNSKTVWWWRI